MILKKNNISNYVVLENKKIQNLTLYVMQIYMIFMIIHLKDSIALIWTNKTNRRYPADLIRHQW